MRQLEGPTEARFRQQDSKIDALETSLKQVRLHQEKMEKAMEAEAAASERRSQDTVAFVKSTVTSIKAEVEQTVKTALQQHTNELNTNLTDLKQLFIQQINKRPRPPGEDDMDEP